MLLDFIFGRESDLTAAFMVFEGTEGYVLLKNKYRGLWELPGGMIDAGETPRQCVVRECREESGQIVADPEFVGLPRLAFAPDAYRDGQTIEYAALYGAWLGRLRPFCENAEISALRWYRPGDSLGDLCPASREMIGLYESRPCADRR